MGSPIVHCGVAKPTARRARCSEGKVLPARGRPGRPFILHWSGSLRAAVEETSTHCGTRPKVPVRQPFSLRCKGDEAPAARRLEFPANGQGEFSVRVERTGDSLVYCAPGGIFSPVSAVDRPWSLSPGDRGFSLRTSVLARRSPTRSAARWRVKARRPGAAACRAPMLRGPRRRGGLL